MEAQEFLGVEPTHNPYRWKMPVTPGISTGHGFLFGGCGLGAAIVALEGTCDRPVIWATAQYLSYARPPSVLDIDVTVAVAGRQTTQARAVGHVADVEILTVNAALGSRDIGMEGEWAERPDVPPPAACPPRGYRVNTNEDSIMSRLDTRLADGKDWSDMDGTPGTGRSALWVRTPDRMEMSAAALAILGDYVPFGIGQALGLPGGGNSLDNTLRVAKLVPTEWVLLDIRVHAVANGFGHGVVHLWSDSGTLMATASQSTIVRLWTEADPPATPGR